ncbi:MAG: DUF4271 domain-containing protein [Crocinitomicaceae bacterium]
MLLVTLDTFPQELIARDHPITLIVGLGMFLSFILIALAKLIQSDIYLRLAFSFFKNKGLYSYLRESFPVQKLGSVLLLANYWISFSLLLLLIFKTQNVIFENNIWVVILVPVFVCLYNVISIFSIGLIANEGNLIQTPIVMKINGAQLLGLGCSALVFLMSLQFIDKETFISLSVVLLVFENSVRLIRSLVYVLDQRVSWYYIILYLCTLEILPLFITWYVLLVN